MDVFREVNRMMEHFKRGKHWGELGLKVQYHNGIMQGVDAIPATHKVIRESVTKQT